MKYLGNGLSLGMLLKIPQGKIKFRWISEVKAKKIARDAKSIVGHESTAIFYKNILQREVPVNRQDIQLLPGDELIVYQIMRRLPEGRILCVRELIDEKRAAWIHVKIE